jgi:hypothetical protein
MSSIGPSVFNRTLAPFSNLVLILRSSAKGPRTVSAVIVPMTGVADAVPPKSMARMAKPNVRLLICLLLLRRQQSM